METGSEIEISSVENVTVGEKEKTKKTEKKKQTEEEGALDTKKKKISPKNYLKEKATKTLSKLGRSRDLDAVSSRTRSAQQPVAARTKSKRAAASSKFEG